MQIANSITHPSLDDILTDGARHLKNDLKDFGLDVVEHHVISDGVDDRKSLQQFMRDMDIGGLPLAIKKKDGTLLQHPPGTYRLEAHDTIMMIARTRAAV
jgi:Trk K+ transport system NAD-binding subunit